MSGTEDDKKQNRTGSPQALDLDSSGYGSQIVATQVEYTDLDKMQSYFISPSSLDLLMQEFIAPLANKENSHIPPMAPITCLALQGGGAKGAAYVGSAEALDKTGTLDNLKYIAGSSAGAINSLMIGLGLNADQIKDFTHGFNLRDLNDADQGAMGKLGDNKLAQVINVLTSSHAYSGDAFLKWARGLLTLIVGDPDITFAEFREKCKTDPRLKEITLTATRYRKKDGQKQDEVFSADLTPDVRVADAVRASMSFPGAFKPHEVYKKVIKDGKTTFKLEGIFADGGILNNYPINLFNHNYYQDAHYLPRDSYFTHTVTPERINPGSIGLSLANIHHLDPNITPYTERLKVLTKDHQGIIEKEIANKKLEEEFIHELTSREEAEKKWGMGDIISAVIDNQRGRALWEDIDQKYREYRTQTIQVFPEGVSTLEFNLSKEKQDLIEASGKNAFYQWFFNFRSPSATFQGDYDDRLTRSEDKLIKQNKDSFYKQKLTSMFLEMQSELDVCKKIRADFPSLSEDLQTKAALFLDVSQNQRLAYLSNQINYWINEYRKIDDDVLASGNDIVEQVQALKNSKIQTILEGAFQQAITEYKNTISNRNAEVQRRNIINNEQLLLDEVRRLLRLEDVKAKQNAAIIFQGQLTKMVDMVAKRGILADFAQYGHHSENSNSLRDVIATLSLDLLQLTQQSRYSRFNLGYLLDNSTDQSIYAYAALSHGDANTKVLLECKANPMKIDGFGKNALHYAIDSGNVEAFVALVNSKSVDLQHTVNGQPIGHYLLAKASPTMLVSLTANYNDVMKKLVQIDAKDQYGCSVLHVVAQRIDENKSNSALVTILQNSALVNISNHQQITVESSKLYSKDSRSLYKLELDAKKDVYNNRLNQADELWESIAQNSNVNDVISKLLPEQVLHLLNKHFVSYAKGQLGDKAKYIPSLIKILEQNNKYELDNLIKTRVNSKTPLYIAAESGNRECVELLRQYYAGVNYSGPEEMPCALTAAAKAGHFEIVTALLASKTFDGGTINEAISRLVKDNQGKSALHHMAINRCLPAQFWNVMNCFKGLATTPNDYYRTTANLDDQGHSPLYYLIESDHANILRYIAANYDKNFIGNSTWGLEHYFDLTTVRDNGLTDLEFALLYYPNSEITRTFLEPNNIKDNSILVAAQQKVALLQANSRNTLPLVFSASAQTIASAGVSSSAKPAVILGDELKDGDKEKEHQNQGPKSQDLNSSPGIPGLN